MIHFSFRDTHGPKVARKKKMSLIFHVHRNPKRTEAAILISDKTDFKTEMIHILKLYI